MSGAFNIMESRFDETEFIVPPPKTSRIVNECPEFYGTLEIEKLEWLSPQGQEWLQLDLRARDSILHPSSNLTLSRLYGKQANEGLRLLVQVHDIKNMSARFMSKNACYPPFYLLTTKPKKSRQPSAQPHHTFKVPRIYSDAHTTKCSIYTETECTMSSHWMSGHSRLARTSWHDIAFGH